MSNAQQANGAQAAQDSDVRALRDALTAFKGGRFSFGAGRVEMAETEDWPSMSVGIPTNKLIRHKITRYISAACNAAPALLQENEQLREQRDALLTALRKTLAVLEPMGLQCQGADACRDARAAIAAAGGAQ